MRTDVRSWRRLPTSAVPSLVRESERTGLRSRRFVEAAEAIDACSTPERLLAYQRKALRPCDATRQGERRILAALYAGLMQQATPRGADRDRAQA